MTLPSELISRLNSLPSLPSPPRAALRIIELAKDPEATLPQVAGVVNCDPALAARVLRVSNSVRYGLGRRCDNLRQALVILGMKATLTVALGFSLVDTLRKNVSTGMDYKKFWQRSLLAAVSARAIGDLLGRRDGENLFLASLLQDIGMLAIDLLVPTLYSGSVQHDALQALEREALGVDHAAVGAWLLQQWNMPDYIPAAVGNSHFKDSGRHDGEYGEISRCVALSGSMADLWLLDERTKPLQKLTACAASLLDIDATDLGILLAKVRDRVPETEAIFEFPLLEGERMQQVLDEAMEMVLVGNLCALQEASALIGEAVGSAGLAGDDSKPSSQGLIELAGGALRR